FSREELLGLAGSLRFVPDPRIGEPRLGDLSIAQLYCERPGRIGLAEGTARSNGVYVAEARGDTAGGEKRLVGAGDDDAADELVWLQNGATIGRIKLGDGGVAFALVREQDDPRVQCHEQR